MKLTTLAVTLLVCVSTVARAEPAPPPRAHHALYAELATILFSNAGTLNYAYTADSGFGLRVGYNNSFTLDVPFGGGGAGYGGHMLATYAWGKGNWQLEADLGISIVKSETPTLFDLALGSDLYVVPSFFHGVRWSPRDGGFLFRAGGTFIGGWGLGASVALGATF